MEHSYSWATLPLNFLGAFSFQNANDYQIFKGVLTFPEWNCECVL